MNTLDWLKKLIAFDTTSRFSNLELIEFLANSLSDHAIEPILIHDSKEPKANLLATIPSRDGKLTGGIILSGHTDVVPVDGQVWDTDPFQAVMKNNKVYGRGACDMKGFIAVVMALLPKMKTMHLGFPIHLAFSYDEEIGCLGAPHIISKIVELNYQPNACIVGEPTMMKPVIGHKGKRSYRCQIHGVAAHSSLTNQGANAIEYGALLISHIRGLADHYKEKGLRDFSYDVPYTTLTTNLVRGGNAYNTIPALCEFIFEYRNLVDDNPIGLHHAIMDYVDQKMVPAMHEEHADTKVVIDTIADAPGLETPATDYLVKAVQSASHCEQLSKVAYATEAGLFQQASIPSVVCGPGSIEQAHCANEYVELEQLHRCEQFIIELLEAFRP